MRFSSRFRGPGEPHGGIVIGLGTYCAATTGLYGTDNAIVRLDLFRLYLRLAQPGRDTIGNEPGLEGTCGLRLPLGSNRRKSAVLSADRLKWE